MSAAAVGKQCFTCRRRQVKCDSTVPSCLRCHRDGRQCLGYRKGLKMVNYTAEDASLVTRRRSGVGKLGSKRAEHVLMPLALPSRSPLSSSSSSSSSPFRQPSPYDADFLTLIETVDCYNKYTVPRMSPAQLPFRRQPARGDIPWQLLPKLVQHTFIVAFRALHAGCMHTDPFRSADLCYYRGLSIRGLREYLEGNAADKHGLALSMMLMMMAADIQASPRGAWRLHFEAARKAISLRGGLAQTLADIPDLRVILVHLAVIDILTGATCHRTQLCPADWCRKEQADYFALLPKLEEEVLAYASPCPRAILQTILLVNNLRSSDQGQGQHFAWQKYDHLVTELLCFDAKTWAASVLQFGKQLPQREDDCANEETLSAFSALGSCFQSAALIYLLSSLQWQDQQNSDGMTRLAYARLGKFSRSLINISSQDVDAPLHTQLWKFLVWPLYISTYASIITCKDDEASDIHFSRFQAFATLLPSMAVNFGLRHLTAQKKRRADDETALWKWDDGFPDRLAII